LDVECDIVNIGDKTITREVTLWHHYQYGSSFPFYVNYWEAIKAAGFAGGIGKVILTLAPGQSFHYYYEGTSVQRVGPNCIELRDNMGDKSELLCLSY